MNFNWRRMEMGPEIWSVLHRNWGWYIALGIALLILGCISIYLSVFSTLFTVVTIGWLMVIGGVALFINAFQTLRGRGTMLTLLLGVFYVIAGTWMIYRPLASALSLTLLLAGFFIVIGILRIVDAASQRAAHWGWVLFNGLISLLLGIMIWRQWPISGLWVIGTFMGIELLLNGWSYLVLGLISRRHLPGLPA